MKNFLLILFLFTAGISSAQVTDNFSDGDFTNNPSWSGDNTKFIVNAALELQLNSSGPDSSYLAIPNTVSIDSCEWNFWIRLNFSPSGNNNSRVYLVSDQQNLKSPLNGYYLQFGEALSNDQVELFRQSGNTSVSVCRGTTLIATSFSIRVKVTRDVAATWRLYIDPTGGNSFQLEATGTDAIFNSTSYFGLVCKYTNTNATAFYFDDFFVGPIYADTTSPALTQVTVLSQNTLDIKFSEDVEQTSAETLTNYSVSNGIGNPSSATRDGIDNSLVHLVFISSFFSPTTYIVTVDSVKDLNNNMMAQDTASFLYFIPAPHDVIINEIMADPDPQILLPAYEYVELYNRSNYSVNLNGWTFSDASSPVTFGNVTMPPSTYLILCSTTSQAQFSVYGNVFGFPTFPSLNNTSGETLTLKNQSGIIIDNVYYDESFYHDSNKGDGGWSIERIDGNFTCANENNWKASADARGGSPGIINSTNGTFTDNTAPEILHVCIIDSIHVQVFFSEAMFDVYISDVSNYAGIGFIIAAAPSADNTSVTLTLASPLGHSIHTISFSAIITDCPGNSIGAGITAQFAFSVSPLASDVIINEVLFNAKTTNSEGEFIELYNRSYKVIDLSELKITREDLTTHILDTSVPLSSECYLLFPGNYIALADNPDAVKRYYYTPNPNAFLQMNLPDLLTEEDIIVLQDASGNILDKLHYKSSWQFPLLNSVDGVSLERLNPDRQTQDSTNWHSAAESVGFATPGYSNSQFNETAGDGSDISIDPEIFSPDNDGNNDVANIHYTFSEPGYVANVTIYDSRGRHVRNLTKNELLGTTGFFTWDGVNDKHEKSSIGIYIVFVEVFRLDGSMKSFKKTCVLASKL